MNFSDSLKDIYNKKTTIKKTIQELEIEKKLLEKNIYVLRVIELADAIEKFCQSKFCQENVMDEFTVWFSKGRKEKDIEVYFRFFYEYDYTVSSKDNKMLKIIEDLAETMKGLDKTYVKDDIQEQVTDFIEIVISRSQNVKETILDIFYSKELKNLLHYSKLEASLGDKENNQSKYKI